jgi:uncharacterized membrane protein YgcG
MRRRHPLFLFFTLLGVVVTVFHCKHHWHTTTRFPTTALNIGSFGALGNVKAHVSYPVTSTAFRTRVDNRRLSRNKLLIPSARTIPNMVARRILSFLCLVVALTCVQSSFFGRSGGWSPAAFPNPMKEPQKCGRKDVPRSQVCDPDGVISRVSQDEIEGHINFIKSGQAAVAVVKKMDLSIGGGDIDRAAEVFCRTLHDEWGVGDKVKNDGVVLFLSIEDRAVFISTGEGSQGRVSRSAVEGIIHRMKPFLRKSDYSGAIINAIIEVEMALNGKPIKGSHHRLPPSTQDDDLPSYAKLLIFVSILAGVGGYGWWQNSRMKRLERGRLALDSLIREVDTARAAEEGDDKVFVTTSCPICLENFSEASPSTADNAETGTATKTEGLSSASDVDRLEGKESSAEKERDSSSSLLRNLTPSPTSQVFTAKTPSQPSNRPMALRCGHTFCRECITAHLKTDAGRRCPICRHPVHKDYDGMDPQRPAAPRPGYGTGTNNTRPGDDDGTSCRPTTTSTGGNQGASGLESVDTSNPSRVNQDPMYTDTSSGWFGSQSRPSGFGARAPEIRYRLNRMRYLYPDVMTVQLLHNMNRAVDRGSLHDMRTELSARSVEIQHTVTQMREAAAQAARSSGSRGSSGMSFGGGRSSGGGGGRW